MSRAPLRVAPRRARDVALPAFYAGDLALIGFGMAVFSNTWFDRLVRATGGLVTDTLLVNLVGIPLLVGGIALGLGRLRPTDIGLRRADLPLALVVLLALWLATQAVALALAWTTGSVVPHPSWAHRGTLGVLGLLLAQVLGNGLLEEIGYRGFLLPQLHHRLGRVVAPRFRLAAAVAVSQALFAAAHAPNRVREGVAGAALVGSVLIALALGVLLALLYLRTGNLLLVVGVHALMNAPTLLIASPIGNEIVEGLAVLLLACWPRRGRPIETGTGRRAAPRPRRVRRWRRPSPKPDP